MPLFECEKCHCVENTALCNYWARSRQGKPALCSECDPEPVFPGEPGGTWHGRFDKFSASEMVLGEDGFLTERDPA